MGSQPSEPMMDSQTIKELGKRRVFMFFWAFVLVAISNTIMEENDIFLHVVDDYTDIALAVVAILILVVWRNKKSLPDLKRENNMLTVLSILLILATIFAITQELGDPTDFGNEIPTLFFGIFLVANRFV